MFNTRNNILGSLEHRIDLGPSPTHYWTSPNVTRNLTHCIKSNPVHSSKSINPRPEMIRSFFRIYLCQDPSQGQFCDFASISSHMCGSSLSFCFITLGKVTRTVHKTSSTLLANVSIFHWLENISVLDHSPWTLTNKQRSKNRRLSSSGVT